MVQPGKRASEVHPGNGSRTSPNSGIRLGVKSLRGQHTMCVGGSFHFLNPVTGQGGLGASS